MLKRALFFLAIALTAVSLAQDVKVDKYRLENGLTVILREDHSLPVVAVNIWYKVGGRDEMAGRSGLAHLFEHLMFMGTARVPRGQFDTIMESGGGSNNASTTQDRTNFYDVGPSNQLPTLLWLEADRMEALGQNIDQKKLDLQRDVVKNEFRESYLNAPYGKARLAVYGAMFPEGHPYHIPVIGTMEDLDAASVQNIHDFFATYYAPNNASMVVAGDFDPKQVKPLIASLFSTLARHNDPIHRIAPPVDYEGVHRVTMLDKVKVPRLMMVWHSAPAYSKGDALMELTASVLGDGVAGRLYHRLVVERDLATDVTTDQESMLLGSLFWVEVTPKEGASMDEVEAQIDDVLADYTKNGPKADELKRQAAKIEYGTLSGLQAASDAADKLNEYEFYLGEPNSFKRVLDEYRDATPRQVRDEARATLRPDARLVLRVLPEGAASSGQSARDKQPEPFREGKFSLPKPVDFKLSNGVAVHYWQRPDLPILQLSMVFKNPAQVDPPAKAGRMDLLASMMDQGGGSMDAADFENALSILGADTTFQATREGFICGLTTLSANFDKALELYAKGIENPRFDQADWGRIRSAHLADLEQALADPGTVARRVATMELFGSETPFGLPIEGTKATVESIRLRDLGDAYQQFIQPRDAQIFAAGSVSADHFQAELQKRLGNWNPAKSEVPMAPLQKEPSKDGLKVYIVDKPGAPQTVIRFLLPAPNFNDPHRIELEALASVLGGTFTSRLNSNLREDKGYSYGAGARFSMNPQVGLFIATSDVRSDVTGPSIKEFLAELNKIRTGDVSSDETTKVKKSMRSDTVQALAGVGGIVSSAVGLYLNGKPFSMLDQELNAIDALTSATINAVAASGIQLDKGVLVLVGDKALIAKQIEGLGLSTPEVVEAR